MAQTDADTLLARAKEDIARLVEALENYLDLHSELKEIVPVSSIRELAETAS